MRAALIYQHATSGRDREIAKGMDRRIAEATVKPAKKGRKKAEKKRKGGRPGDGPSPATGP